MKNADIITRITKEITLFNLTVKQYLQARMREHHIDLTFEMLQVLYYLWKEDGVNQQEIATAIAKDKASITYVLDNLAKRNYIYRQEGEDRRNKLIFLTDEGKALRAVINPWIEAMQKNAAQNISLSEIEIFLSTLGKIRSNLTLPQVANID